MAERVGEVMFVLQQDSPVKKVYEVPIIFIKTQGLQLAFHICVCILTIETVL